MRVVGLTGSIASGKSTVSRELLARGIPVIDGDQLSRELTGVGGIALPEIRLAFGDACFFPDGSLNRKALGQIIFSSDEKRARLDSLMAPFLRSMTEERLASLRAQAVPLCFLEMPLLFEKGYDVLCDTVWCVWLPDALQEQRLMQRDGCTREEARQRIRAVLSSGEKAARSDVVIDNSGTEEELLAKLPPLLDAEIQKSAVRRRRSDRYLAPSDQHPSLHSAGTAPSVPPSVPSPAVSASPSPAADVMQRPAAARKQTSRRQVSWRLPVWLMTLMIVCGTLLAVSFTAQCLMRAYLRGQAEKHAAEQQSIDDHYPLLYRDLIERYSAQYNLTPAFVSAIIRNESSFRPMAESSVGARGLMQLMPKTAEWIAGKLKIQGYAFDRMYDPESNIHFGCWYLSYLSDLFRGDPLAVTCAYHAGQGEIAGWLSNPAYSPDGISLILEQLPEGPTKLYAGRVTRDYGIYQAKYFTDAVSDASASDPL